jgi:hypothetical protein
MALVYEGMTCAICEHPLDIHGPFVATSHFIGDETDPLWPFSDAAMHYDCFQAWDHREAFVKKYNDTMGQQIWGNGTRHHMNPDGSIVSVKGPASSVVVN